MTNTGLQAIIQTRISDHCQKMTNMGMITNRDEIEKVMTRVWAFSIGLDAV